MCHTPDSSPSIHCVSGLACDSSQWIPGLHDEHRVQLSVCLLTKIKKKKQKWCFASPNPKFGQGNPPYWKYPIYGWAWRPSTRRASPGCDCEDDQAIRHHQLGLLAHSPPGVQESRSPGRALLPYVAAAPMRRDEKPGFARRTTTLLHSAR